MRRCLALVLSLIPLAGLLAGPPAVAQTDAERTEYEPQFVFGQKELLKEVNAIVDLQAQMEKESDLVRGCGLLHQSLVHLKAADKILTDLEFYTQKLRRPKDYKAAKAQHGDVLADIQTKQGDIDRLCSSVSAPALQ